MNRSAYYKKSRYSQYINPLTGYGLMKAYKYAKPMVMNRFKARKPIYKKSVVATGKVQPNSSQPKSLSTKYRRSRALFKRAPARKKVQKRLSVINKKLERDQGKLTFRWRSTGRILASANQQNFSSITAVSVTSLETVLANLKYYDPANPGTLVTADATSGSYQKDFTFAVQYAKGVIRNNYQSPCRVTLYFLMVKDDTSINPPTAFSNGLVDTGGVSETSPLAFVSDSIQFKDLWKIAKSTKVELQPGEEYKFSFKTRSFEYDPSLTDSHPDAYQTRNKAYAICARVEGVIGHDTSADEQGILQSGIDWVLDRTWVVEYSAGVNINYIVINDTSDAFTNGGVVSQKPIPDNLGYSIN